ncbi:delta subunit of GMP phosphodiesterase [Tribonema minus]|uniref:Delta subunit of GMP phosphodiesterase n=1 Tax=Tribonema minus TaxID=303371 RepID=A0A835Z4X9_9STRA|nr:delta subunit of GMP phosphodiesterase [Tribonema minus]
MDMRDAETGKLLWESGKWGQRMLREEMQARVPKEILECRAVSRELNFTSQEEIRQFRLEQRIFLRGACLEEWFFDFGFVIPGSTNSWQQTIEAAAPEDMRHPAELSGKVTIETSFYDGKTLIAKTLVRVFYV